MEKKSKPKYFKPLVARGYINDELMEFEIKCHACGSDWVKKKGKHPYNPELQMFKCNDCGKNFDTDTWINMELVKRFGLTLTISFSDLLDYSAKRMASRFGWHPTTYEKYEHIFFGAIVEQLEEISKLLLK